jgi:predicted outer membrane repeat protein
LPFLQADNGTIIIDQSLFYNNTCLSSGGALYTTFSNITITNTNFLNNTASSGAAIKVYRSDLNVSQSVFQGGVAWSDGGAVEMVESTGWIHDSLVEGNSASSAGAMKLAGSNVTFEKLTIRRNSARNVGGVFDTFLSNTIINNCIFQRNMAMNTGGTLSGYQVREKPPSPLSPSRVCSTESSGPPPSI